MNEMTVGVRELKSRLSEYLPRVRAGETVVMTDRGQPVGRIVPVGQVKQPTLSFPPAAARRAWRSPPPRPASWPPAC